MQSLLNLLLCRSPASAAHAPSDGRGSFAVPCHGGVEWRQDHKQPGNLFAVDRGLTDFRLYADADADVGR